MTKKTISKVAKAAKSVKGTDGPIPTVIKESAQQIWSKSVDAINRAQQGGNRVFETLVREGEALRENLHQKTRKATSVTEVTARATDTWDKLEQVFESRVARALARLGVPTRTDISELNKRIDDLTRLVRQSSGAANPAKSAAPRKATVKPRASKTGV